jgi:catechol 2,3-dioxygenase-like lactoylglutathione lyase family enzyme
VSRSALHHHVGLSVADLDEAEHWYVRAFGMDEVVERVELPEPPVRTVVLRASNGLRIELIERAGSQGRSFADPLEAASTRGFGYWALEVERPRADVRRSDLARRRARLATRGRGHARNPFRLRARSRGEPARADQPPSGGEDLVDQ